MAISPIHWETTRLIEVLSEMKTGETVPYADLAKRCDMSEVAVKRRLQAARPIVLRDHHVIVITVRKVGVQRLAQDLVTIPVEKQRNKIRSSARRSKQLIADGVTDWDKLDSNTRTKLFVESAVTGVVMQATDHHSRKKIAAQVVANGQLNVGRTLELLK